MIEITVTQEQSEAAIEMAEEKIDRILEKGPKENAKEVKNRLEDIMVHIVDGVFKIPMKCDIEVTERWYGEGIEL